MFNQVNAWHRLNFRILFTILIIFIGGTFTISYLNRRNLTQVHESKFQDYVLLTNRLISKIVNYDDTKHYLDILNAQGEGFRQRQIQFNEDRLELYRLIQDGKKNSPEYAAVMGRIRAFRNETDKFKDARYWEIIAELESLKKISQAKYIYVMADQGLRTAAGEHLVSYVFIASDTPTLDEISYDNDWLGTTAVGEPVVENIYETGMSMDSIIYYNDFYGELCYAYTAIKNDQNNIIGLLGTDISLDQMRADIKTAVWRFDFILIILMLLTISVIFIFQTKFVIKPLYLLTKTATDIFAGDLDASVPQHILKDRSELGVLATAFQELNIAFKQLIVSMEKIFDAAIIGKLDVREPVTHHQGRMKGIIYKMNDTLDIVVTYLNLVPASIFIMSRDFKVNFWNESFAANFGHLPIRKLFNLIYGPDCDFESGANDEVLSSLLISNPNVTFLLDDNCYSVMIRVVESQNLNQSVFMVVLVDITDLNREKEKAERAMKYKSEFLSRMSHEIRTPMNAVIGALTLIRRTDDQEKTDRYISTIESSSKLLLSIINNVLDMSKIEAGKLSLESLPFNLKRTIQVIRAITDAEMERKRLAFSCEFDDYMQFDYLGDETRLSQIIMNILGNAIKFTPEGGRIEMRVSELARDDMFKTVFFSITDTGIGMNGEHMTHLFSYYDQADETISRRFGGTGLGLAIARSLVEMMGGRIWAESAPGLGSTFNFTVKLVSNLVGYAASEDSAGNETVDFSNRTILLVEDIAMNREILLELLSETKAWIEWVADGSDAVRAFRENPEKYDLIIMDVHMPNVDGLEATRRIRSLNHPRAALIPIIGFSADVFVEDVNKCLASGMNDHLSKPVNYERMIEMFRKFLG
jgi:signal transduction histidine kinase/ActR/RegA family two-component response regulator